MDFDYAPEIIQTDNGPEFTHAESLGRYLSGERVHCPGGMDTFELGIQPIEAAP